MNILELITSYRHNLEDDNTSSSNSYKSTLSTLEKFIKNENEINEKSLVNYRKFLFHSGLEKDSIKLYIFVFKRLLIWATQKDVLDHSLVKKVFTLYEKNKAAYSDADYQRAREILKYYENPPPEGGDLIYMRDRAILYLLAGSGLPLNRIIKLNRDEFDKFFVTWDGESSMIRGDLIIFSKFLQPVKEYLDNRDDKNKALFLGHSTFKGDSQQQHISRQAVYKTFKISPHILKYCFD